MNLNALLSGLGRIKENELMKNYTSFQIGGPADLFVEPATIEEVQALISFFKKAKAEYMVIGNGSNMLVGDKGIRGIVIKIGKQLDKIVISDDEVTAEAGVLLSRLANTVAKEGLSGLEFAAGIPGSLGGGIYMNAGAYGGELKNVITEVTYLNQDGKIKTSLKEELDFGYRHSMFEDGKYVILSCKMQLKARKIDEIKAEMADYAKRRSDKQPLNMPSAGSTFKRPEGYFAGKLIQDANLMGYSIGGAQVSEKHAGFIVNKGNATAQDVLDLIQYVKEKVKEQSGVTLEPEVRLIGEQ